MSVELTPKGTHGAKLPRFPRPFAWVFWKLFSLAARLLGYHLLDLTKVGARTSREHTVPLAWFSGELAGPSGPGKE